MKNLLLITVFLLLAPALAHAGCDGTLRKPMSEKESLIWGILDFDKIAKDVESKSHADISKLNSAITDPKVARWAAAKISDIQKRCLVQITNSMALHMNEAYSMEELKVLPELMALKDKEAAGSLSAADKTKMESFVQSGLAAKLDQTQLASKKINEEVTPLRDAEVTQVTNEIMQRQLAPNDNRNGTTIEGPPGY